jgi:hypothetical protein
MLLTEAVPAWRSWHNEHKTLPFTQYKYCITQSNQEFKEISLYINIDNNQLHGDESFFRKQ